MVRDQRDPDIRLLAAVADGDVDALGDLYDRFSPRVYGLLRVMLPDPREAEDVLQEVFLQLWRDRTKYDSSVASPTVWVLLVTRSRAIDRLRHVRRERDLAVNLAADLPGNGDANPPDSTESCRRARRALSRLPDDQRETIQLAFYRGLTHTEIADLKSIPLGTVKTRIRSGMQRLRELLQPHQEEMPTI